MAFKMKYDIKTQYLTKGTKRRSGIKMPRVGFVVGHDTGNPGSTAKGNVNYYENSRNEMSASAHTFIDDKEIIECIPATIGTPEKAWHVLYNVTKDNEMYGDDANDIAIGVELCYGESYKNGKLTNKIDDKESYKRYIWYIAYVCYKFKLDPSKYITGHYVLDPKRKTDPALNSFVKMGITWSKFLNDVIAEYKECSGAQVDAVPVPVEQVIKMGDKNNNVVALQSKLNTLGYGLVVDGDFGKATYNAVADFQKNNGLTVDGIAGQKTVDKLNEILNAPKVVDKKDKGDDEPMEMAQWQKTLIIEGVKKFGKVIVDGEPVINSPETWIKKVNDGTLTAGELSSLTFAIVSRTQE